MTYTYCVFGEGPNDIGIVAYGDNNKISQEGCYAGYLKAAFPVKDLKCRRAEKLKNIKLPGEGMKRSVANKLTGYRYHAYYAARMAATDGADILLIGADVDRGRSANSTAAERVKALHNYRKEFADGYKIACKENPSVEQIRFFIIVPLCKLESWLLADEKAFFKATGIKRGELPKQPEKMFGVTDSKIILNSLFEKRGKGTPCTAILFDIARKSSPDVLSVMCPNSYTPFLAMCKS